MTTLTNFDGAILPAGTTILTTGADTQLILKATINNQDASSRTVTVYRVPNGGTAGAANEIIAPLTVIAGDTVALPLSGQSVQNGQSLQMVASATATLYTNITWMAVT